MSKTAFWISQSGHPSKDVGVFAFECTIELEILPPELWIDVSADQRYKLYLNGFLVGHGPQRGDPEHWFYEKYDLAPQLSIGKNQLVAIVWNFGWLAPIAQMTTRLGFACRSEVAGLTTPGNWRVSPDERWSFDRRTAKPTPFYMEVGPGETFDSRVDHPTASPQNQWGLPIVVGDWKDHGSLYESQWSMVPRSIPPLEYALRNTQPNHRRGFKGDTRSQPFDQTPMAEPVDLTSDAVVLDYLELLCAYPRIRLVGDPGVVVSITYDEGLWEPETVQGVYGPTQQKGNRDEVSAKEARGLQDQVVLSGSLTEFEPLWWRTYRYVTIQADGPARLIGIDAYETGYPYKVESEFTSDDSRVVPIWETAVRTAKRCAGETYFDCPFYEQLQYAGDTRIQALIHYYLSTDRRLARNAVAQLGWSFQPNGLTQSRYPNRTTQFIPPFSLWWAMMLYDQMLYDGEIVPDNISISLAKIACESFRGLQQLELQGTKRHWMFADWVPAWRDGVPPGGANSTIHSLTLLMAETACDLMQGDPLDGKRLEVIRAKGRENLITKYKRIGGLVCGQTDPDWSPSEHAEALFRMLQTMCGIPADRWPTKALEATQPHQTTLYFSYYRHLANQSEDYFSELGPWLQMIEDGLTTFAETPEPARSDCHAWSAHPILGLFQIVAGITSIAPGWTMAQVAPRPGSLKRFRAAVAHPSGELSLVYDENRYVLDTPIPVQFSLHKKVTTLKPGRHTIAP